jgi:hypothetical protein
MLEKVNADVAPDGMYTRPSPPVLELERTVFVIGGARYRLQRLPDEPTDAAGKPADPSTPAQ